ncbi:MAG: hypothetical protein JO052_04825 [Bradyrhizobium sp.]|nr:hypothetical protein [Bradyrhizobium sp.]
MGNSIIEGYEHGLPAVCGWRARPSILHDGQFAHARHAQIARRASLSRQTCSIFQKST